MPQIQTQSVGVGGSTANITALNRLYSNPTTSAVVQRQVLKVFQQTRSPLASGQYSSQLVGGKYQTSPLSSLVQAGSGIQSPNSPARALSNTAAQMQARYGSSISATGGGLSVLATGYASQAPVAAQMQARNEWLKTTEGRAYAALQRAYLAEYPYQSGDSITGTPSAKNLQDFARLKATEAYNDKLQRAIDDYQAKPENRRDLYDREVAKGNLTAPSGYKSDALDRYRKQYGDEKSVGDVKPYDDLTPDYTNLKPDIVFRPDGTVTYEKPDPNSSNIPLVLVPGNPTGNPFNPEAPENNTFASAVQLNFFNPASRSSASNPVISYSIGGPSYFDRNTDTLCQSVTYTLLSGGTATSPFRPGTLSVAPYNGSSTTPTNRPSTAPAPQPIPTKPDGTADLKPFDPTTSNPTKPFQSPQHSPQPTATKSPQLSPLGKLDSPQLQTPARSPLPLQDIAPLPAGMPITTPPSPLSRFLDPRVRSTGVGENNPVKARSINPTLTPVPSVETTPQMVSVPTTSNPTKIDTPTAVKVQEQLQPQAKPQTKPQKARQCEDPCVQGLHDKLDSQSNVETIEFNIFKECDKDTGEAVYTQGTLPVPKLVAGIVKGVLDRLAESQGKECSTDCECYAAIPDWWQIRLGADIPQAIVQYAEVKDGDKFGSPKYAVSIPHYAKSKEATQAADFPTYMKGQKMGILTLRDNSKLIVNASSGDVERVIKQLQNMIAPLWLNEAIYSDGQRKGTKLKTINVAPRIVKFFPNGQTDLKPQWIKYF